MIDLLSVVQHKQLCNVRLKQKERMYLVDSP
jgi:hypothetical protein